MSDPIKDLLTVFFSAPAEGKYLLTNKYTTEVFSKVFQNIGQVMTKQ